MGDLTGVFPEPGAKMTHRWIAVWRLPSAVIHQTLPLTVQHDTKAEALAYATANPPTWGTP
jgi:hypothetical protein